MFHYLKTLQTISNLFNKTELRDIELWVYTRNSMTKIYNPYFTDVISNDKMYFDSIEDILDLIGLVYHFVVIIQ